MNNLIKNKDKNEYSPKSTRFYIKKKVLDDFLAVKPEIIPAGAKLVILYFLDSLFGKEYCWPALGTIAKKYGYSVKQIENHLSRLKKQGYITWDKGGVFRDHYDLEKKTRSNKYHLGYFLVEENIEKHKKKIEERSNRRSIKNEF